MTSMEVLVFLGKLEARARCGEQVEIERLAFHFPSRGGTEEPSTLEVCYRRNGTRFTAFMIIDRFIPLGG